MSADSPQAGPGTPLFSPATPSPARLYDYYLGGKDNYESDRQAAAEIYKQIPDLPEVARDNRAFLQLHLQRQVLDALAQPSGGGVGRIFVRTVGNPTLSGTVSPAPTVGVVKSE